MKPRYIVEKYLVALWIIVDSHSDRYFDGWAYASESLAQQTADKLNKQEFKRQLDLEVDKELE